ncbi:MAG TPA: hypothetical protein VHL08_10935 [Dongiaceae bacterium]|nr:hypothetical protein [Dongiaceae bacterium]
MAGCQASRIDNIYVDSSYTPDFLHHVPYNHALWAEVSGNPFAVPQEDFSTKVNAAIQAPGIAPDPRSPFRIRMAFLPRRGNQLDTICTAEGQAMPSSMGKFSVLAALCYGGKLYTYINASIETATGPDDPLFIMDMRYIVIRLFPDCAYGSVC